MNTPLEPENPLDADLSRFRLVPPSAGLRDQVLDAARKAWDDVATSAELPWRLPVLRLAACITAASLLVALANLADGHWAANRQLRTLRMTHTAADPVQNAYPQLPALPMGQPYRSRRETSHDVVHYVQQVERLLRNTPEPETDDSPDPSPHTWLRRDTSEYRKTATFTTIYLKEGLV